MSCGVTIVAASTSSKPTIATSAGTRVPSSRATSIAPIAIRSLAQKTASGRLSAGHQGAASPRNRRAGSSRRAPSGCVDRASGLRIAVGSPGRVLARMRGGPWIMAMRWQPRPIRCRAAARDPTSSSAVTTSTARVVELPPMQTIGVPIVGRTEPHLRRSVDRSEDDAVDPAVDTSSRNFFSRSCSPSVLQT